MAISNITEHRARILVPQDISVNGGYMNYGNFVQALVKEMGSLDNNLTHMALGIAGEAGEFVDAIKKLVIYDKPLDRQNVVEELGDLYFYMAGAMLMLEISESEMLQANVDKLSERYKGLTYSNEAAIARADKVLQDPVLGVVGDTVRHNNIEPAEYLAPDGTSAFTSQLPVLSPVSIAGMDETTAWITPPVTPLSQFEKEFLTKQDEIQQASGAESQARAERETPAGGAKAYMFTQAPGTLISPDEYKQAYDAYYKQCNADGISPYTYESWLNN